MNLEMQVVPAATPSSAVSGVQNTPKIDTAIKNADGPNAAATTTPAPAEPQKDLYSERAAALVRKEKNAFREKQEAKALRAQIAQKEAELAAKEKRISEFESIKQTNPLKALEMLGLDYNALTQIYLNNGQVTPDVQIKNVESKIERLERERLETEQRRLEEAKLQAEREAQEVLTDFRNEINSFVGNKADTYELINLFAQQNLVYDTIQEYFNTHKNVLSIKEASDLVEKYLEDQLKKSTATNKFKKLLGSQEPTTKDNFQQKQTNQQPRTLSNNMTSSAASYLPAKTEQDRINRALAALEKNK